ADDQHTGAGGRAWRHFLRASSAISRTTTRWILPVAVLGRPSSTSTCRGRLNAASPSRQNAMSSPPSTACPALPTTHAPTSAAPLRPVAVPVAHHPALGHRLVLDDARLDLGRRYPDAAGLDHVVGPAQAGVEAVLRPDIGVAGPQPLAGEHLPGGGDPAPVPG